MGENNDDDSVGDAKEVLCRSYQARQDSPRQKIWAKKETWACKTSLLARLLGDIWDLSKYWKFKVQRRKYHPNHW